MHLRTGGLMRTRIAHACVLAGLFLCLMIASAPAQDQAPVAGTTHILTPAGTHVYTERNGLVVLVRENHFTPVVSVRVVVRTGSIYEGKYLGSGISHLCEHLVHSAATPKRTEEQNTRLLDELGGNSNAGTTNAWTSYYIDTASSRLPDAVDLLADWTNNAIIPEKEFDREHEVVTRELERGEDSVGQELYRLAIANVYRVHPVRIPVIGYLSQLKALTRQDVLDYYHSRYVPNNMVVGIVGDVDAAKAHDLVQQAFSKYDRKPLPDVVLPDEPLQVGFRPLIQQRPDLNLTRMLMEFPTVKLDDPDMYPLDLLSFILSRGESSRLVRELRDKRQLVSGIDTSSYTPNFVLGAFSIEANMKPGTHETVRAALWDQLERVSRSPVSDAELRQAKTQKVSELVFSNEDAGDQCSQIVFDYVSTFDPDYSRAYVDRIQRVTAADVSRVARKYFLRNRECLTVLEPTPPSGPAAAPASVQKSAAPETQLFTLPNGMKLLVKRNPASPAVSIQAFVLGGLRSDSIAKNGLPRLAAEMLVRGTRSRSADELARAFESMGGAIGSASGNNAIYVSAAVLARHTDPALSLIADVLRNPAFSPDELVGLRRRTLLAIQGQNDALPSIASRAFRKAVFPASVFGLDPLGTPDTVNSITRDDLLAYYRAHVKPSGLVLAVYGDVDPQHVLKTVQTAFGSWKESPVVPETVTLDKPPSAPVFQVKEVQKRNQTAIVQVGYYGLRITDVADADAMMVMEAVMAGYGYPGGWLHTELRGDEKGLVYEVHAGSAAWLDTGLVSAYAQCQPDKVVEVTRIILDAFARARAGKVTPDELALARERIITTRLLASQTNAAQASEAAVDELYGLGYRFPDSLPKRIQAVTLEDLARVARKYFTNPVVVVTTPDPKAAAGIDTFSSEK